MCYNYKKMKAKGDFIMSLLGLLLCGLGIGYAVHKDNQKFTNMNREATRLYGRGVNEPFDEKTMTNRHYRELKGYFNEQYNYYMNDKDYIMKNTNIKIQMSNLPDDLKQKYSLDKVQQAYAGWLSYEDMCAKYAPDFVRFAESISHSLNHYSPECFSLIATAMTRKEAYKMGFKPSHMENMNCQFYNAKLYFYRGYSGVGMEDPSEYSYESLDKENPFKYLTEYSLNNNIYYARI